MKEEVSVDLPTDDRGMLDRQCPNCGRLFSINRQQYSAQHYLNLRCPYCNHIEDREEFTTEQQVEYVQAVALSERGVEMVQKELEDSLGDMLNIGDTTFNNSISSPHTEFSSDQYSCPECDFEYETLSSETQTDCPVCR